MGNRVFGCDDCQLVCPWNKFSPATREDDFHPRHGLEGSELRALFAWDEATFLERTQGSAIRRTGYDGWLRNLAVGLGNAPPDPATLALLEARREGVNEMVREHIDWAIKRNVPDLPQSPAASTEPCSGRSSGEGKRTDGRSTHPALKHHRTSGRLAPTAWRGHSA